MYGGNIKIIIIKRSKVCNSVLNCMKDMQFIPKKKRKKKTLLPNKHRRLCRQFLTWKKTIPFL